MGVGARGTVATSGDGYEWTADRVFNPGVAADLPSVTYGNGQFVAVGAGGTIERSDSGKSWIRLPSRDMYE